MNNIKKSQPDFSLLNNEVHLHYVFIVNEKPSVYLKLLSDAEMERANKYRIEKERDRFIISRGLLRKLIGQYVSMNPKEIIFDYGVNGKPFLKNNDVQFNMAHAEDAVLFGFTRHFDIGVDLEYLDRQVNFLKMSSFIFSSNELEVFNNQPKEDKKEAFINCWTRKEAFLKAKGAGLTFPIDQLEVSFVKNEKAELRATKWALNEKEQWSLEGFTLAENFRIAVAVNGKVNSIKIFPIGNKDI